MERQVLQGIVVHLFVILVIDCALQGLGMSKNVDAQDYFNHMAKHMIPFATAAEGDKELIELAFSKKKANERKDWLCQYKVHWQCSCQDFFQADQIILQPGTFLDHNMDEISFSNFINKELILCSMVDNVHFIPFVADRLKPGQRNVIWACFKCKLKKEIKVLP